MEKDYLQLALQTFNGGNWYGWKKKMTMETKFLTNIECVMNV